MPTGDWTRVSCVTEAHATACSTAVDSKILISLFLSFFLSFILSFFLPLSFTLPQYRTNTSGTYNQNAFRSDACRGSNGLWIRTPDRYTRAGLPEWVDSTISGQQPDTTYDSTQTKDTPSPRIKIKGWPHRKSNPDRPGLEGRDSTNHDTVMDEFN